MAKRPMTNIEKVSHMMNFSNFGALKQVFVMEALRIYSEQCAAVDAKALDTGFVSGQAWQGVANEVLKELNTEMKINDPELDDDEGESDDDGEGRLRLMEAGADELR